MIKTQGEYRDPKTGMTVNIDLLIVYVSSRAEMQIVQEKMHRIGFSSGAWYTKSQCYIVGTHVGYDSHLSTAWGRDEVKRSPRFATALIDTAEFKARSVEHWQRHCVEVLKEQGVNAEYVPDPA